MPRHEVWRLASSHYASYTPVALRGVPVSVLSSW